jgi:hypothetical protein
LGSLSVITQNDGTQPRRTTEQQMQTGAAIRRPLD